MDSEMSSVILNNNTQESSIFSRNCNVTELLQICIQPNTKFEMETILLDFWDKFNKCVQVNSDFCEGDMYCLYALDYVYKYKYLSLSAVSRTVYAYMLQNNLPPSESNRNKLINCSQRSFVTALDQFTNLHSLKGEEILKDAAFKCVYTLNLGLLQFFIKFGLLELPTDFNEESKEMVADLVHWFNSAYKNNVIGNMRTDWKISMKVDDFFNQAKLSDISLKRTMLVFICICIIFEYQALENLEMKLNFPSSIDFIHSCKNLSVSKLVCLEVFMETTTETFISLNDIVKFKSTFLSFLPNESFGLSFEDISKKVLSESFKCYNPRPPKCLLEYCNTRSLKDITRCKIRESLRSSTKTLPEQVHQLPIPCTLKTFLLFGKEEIFNPLSSYQQVLYVNNKISRYVRT